METDERNNDCDCEEKGRSEMQTMPDDPCTTITNESDESTRILSSAQDEKKVGPPPALAAGSDDIEICFVMEATEIRTHLQTAHDVQISDPDISKTEQHHSVIGADQLEKDNFVINEIKEVSEVNITDGSMDLESRTTDENVKEEKFEIDFKSGDFLYQASGSWAEFDHDDDCFLKGCKWLVI